MGGQSKKPPPKSARRSYAAAHNYASLVLQTMRSFTPIYLFYKFDTYQGPLNTVKTLAHNTAEFVGKLFSNSKLIPHLMNKASAKTSPYLNPNKLAFKYQASIALTILSALCVYHIAINIFKKDRSEEEENQSRFFKLLQSPIISAIMKASSAYFLTQTVMHSNASLSKVLAMWLTKDRGIALGKMWLFDPERYQIGVMQWEFLVQAIIIGSALVIIASELFRLGSEELIENKTSSQIADINTHATANPQIDYSEEIHEKKREKEEGLANWFLFGNLAATACYLLISSYLSTHKEAFAIGFVVAEVGLAAIQLVSLTSEAIKHLTPAEKIT